MTADEFKEAIDDRAEEFGFPEGYELSSETFNAMISKLGNHSLHENRAEYTRLGFTHMGAWGHTWLQAHAANDSETMNQAMDQLMTVTLSNPMYINVVDHYREIFEHAQAGRTQHLERLLRHQCESNIFESTPLPHSRDKARVDAQAMKITPMRIVIRGNSSQTRWLMSRNSSLGLSFSAPGSIS